jgi:hypothetical protein
MSSPLGIGKSAGTTVGWAHAELRLVDALLRIARQTIPLTSIWVFVSSDLRSEDVPSTIAHGLRLVIGASA